MFSDVVILCLGQFSEQLYSIHTLEKSLGQCPEDDERRLETIFLKALPNANISYIFKIQNMFLTSLYQLKKEEYKIMFQDFKELELFHVTNKDVFKAIKKENLNWRKVVRHKFGHGISFSPDIDYANYFSNKKNRDQRVVLVCKVLVAVPFPGSTTLIVPPPQFDCSVSPDGYTYVKFNDNEFLPMYAIFFECTQDILENSKFNQH